MALTTPEAKAIATVAEYIDAKGFVDHYYYSTGSDDVGWEAHVKLRDINATPGTDELRALADAEGDEFNAIWLRKKRGSLRPLGLDVVDAMSPKEFESAITGGGKAEIPVEYRTRTMNNSDAARLHAGTSQSNPTMYLKAQYEKGLLTRPMGSGQKLQFDWREFPAAAQSNIR